MNLLLHLGFIFLGLSEQLCWSREQLGTVGAAVREPCAQLGAPRLSEQLCHVSCLGSLEQPLSEGIPCRSVNTEQWTQYVNQKIHGKGGKGVKGV